MLDKGLMKDGKKYITKREADKANSAADRIGMVSLKKMSGIYL